MKNLNLISIIALVGVLFFSSCNTDDVVNNPINEQNQESQSFFLDLFNQGVDGKSNFRSILAHDAAGVYNGTYTINKMLANSDKKYDDVLDKDITIEVDTVAKTIYLNIEPFAVGNMPGEIDIRMRDLLYTESGNTVHFTGTRDRVTHGDDIDGVPYGFTVLGVNVPVTVDATITKTGTQYTMQLKFTAQATWGSMVIDADVDFSGDKQ